ncbi:hypothetical protein CQA49_05995 [Helicobacter sp. MIT 00-7814]|uniref:Gfo/Idh/MocA family oxidoreductase n=1 Tax=unclassified Helicobacter TaxID=2593540 RepID=UPI000E1E8E1D|nr:MULTISPECIES: Gfo/Idh/MocA family oxidoreductase [unclassified Helicobacter]RDU53434.1 hypothetical protein CQA37_06900 [Helicobacter sp. MIT 99-10781]RDU53733.1 hypothetical protein CQA49_05995 [Helicobacter sp. MIT 00-7814]
MQKLDSIVPFPSVLIGKGYWGSILTRYIQENPNFHLLKTFGSEFKIQLLPKDCKCAFVATPLDSHFELCKELLSKGIYVFVEKPTCRSLAELEYLYLLSTQNNTICYTDYPYTLSPSIQHIQALLLKHSHLLQAPLQFKAKITQYGKFYKNEGALEVLGVHWLSVFALFFKEIVPFKVTTQTTSPYPLSVCIKARAKFLDSQFKDKDFPINLELACSLECEEKARMLEISAPNFSIYFDMLNSPKITFKIDSKKTQYFDFDETNTLAFCMQDFACAIKDKEYATKILSVHRRVIKFLESCVEALKSPLALESATQISNKGTL